METAQERFHSPRRGPQAPSQPPPGPWFLSPAVPFLAFHPGGPGGSLRAGFPSIRATRLSLNQHELETKQGSLGSGRVCALSVWGADPQGQASREGRADHGPNRDFRTWGCWQCWKERSKSPQMTPEERRWQFEKETSHREKGPEG